MQQAPTWSSIDYHGNWKVLHYSVKEFFKQVLVSAFEQKGALEVHVTSDITDSIQGMVKIDILTYSNISRKSFVIPFELEGNGSKGVFKHPSLDTLLSELHLPREDVVIHIVCDYSMPSQGKEKPKSDDWEVVSDVDSSENIFFPSSLASVNLEDPRICLTDFKALGDKKGIAFQVSCSAVAPFVWLESDFSGRFSQNGFTQLSHLPRWITFELWEDESCSVDIETLKKSLRVRSVWDTLQEK